MKVLCQFLLLIVIAACAQAVSIRTRVWIKKTGKDQAGPNNELITTIMEMGNGQSESATTTVNVPTNSNFGGLGVLLADKTFSGTKLPKGITVRVIEDDGSDSRDDGVCNVKISTKFTKKPINVICTREANDGLGDINIVNVRIQAL